MKILETAVEANIMCVDRLRQAVLSDAFSGTPPSPDEHAII